MNRVKYRSDSEDLPRFWDSPGDGVEIGCFFIHGLRAFPCRRALADKLRDLSGRIGDAYYLSYLCTT